MTIFLNTKKLIIKSVKNKEKSFLTSSNSYIIIYSRYTDNDFFSWGRIFFFIYN